MFYGVSNAKDYYNFYRTLREKAEQRAVKLREFEPL
jgi:hypothetical protein